MRLMMMTMVAGALAVPVEAALPCNVYDDHAAEAVMIMQVVPISVIPPDGGGYGRCVLRGEIVRSFMGPHPVGTVIETMIACWSPLPPGGEFVVEPGASYSDFDELRDAAVVELHIAPEGGPVDTGVVLLEAPTEAPVRQSACDG